MRIGIDVKSLNPRAGGIGRYALELSRALCESADRHGATIVLFDSPQTDRTWLAQLAPSRVASCRWRSSVLRGVAALPRAAVREGVDIVHGLDHAPWPSGSAHPRAVATVHDVLPLTRPRWFGRKHALVARWALERTARRACRVIVPSRAVARAFAGLFPDAEARLRIVPEGCSDRFHPEPGKDDRRRLDAIGVRAPFVLTVGTLEPRKNHAMLFRAFERARRSGRLPRRCTLVAAGRRAWGRPPRVGEGVRLTGFVDEPTLAALYRGCAMVAFPTLDEGFGLPALEAQACGSPLVRSSIPVLDEVAGDASLAVDPSDERAWADAISWVWRDTRLRRRLSEAGVARARRFAWSDAAESTWRVYAEALAA